MPSLQDFLAGATQKAAADLIAALDSIPAEKRAWQPSPHARSAMDQIAECALTNGVAADTILNQKPMDASFMQSFAGEKARLAQDETEARALLEKNAARVTAAIQAAPDAAMEVEIALPWATMTLAQICGLPPWNMSYHQGQITYIGSLLKE